VPKGKQTSTFVVLETYLKARAAFTNDDLEFIETMFVPASLGANEFLQRAGAVASTPHLSSRAACGSTSSMRTARSTSSSSLRRPGGWLMRPASRTVRHLNTSSMPWKIPSCCCSIRRRTKR
jgi:hypothetical protein